MATNSSILSWKIPWTEEPSRLQFMGSQAVGHDLSNLACMHSPWDHCTVRGLCLHHSCKFLSHLRKPKLAQRSLVPFLQSKALMYFPHFYPDIFYNGSQIEKKCQISLLLNHSAKTMQSLQWSNLGIFQLSPLFLDFFPPN